MTGRNKVTLKDIATKTGFSVNTVSVALRGGKKIPEATRQLIRDAARELDYLPNALARSLARKNSGTVGLILSNLQNPILTYCAERIERHLERHGYQMILRSTDGNLEREKRSIDSLRQLQVEGVLIYPSNHRDVEHLVALRRSGLPIVMLAGPTDMPVDLVASDDHASAEAIVSYLIATGHRRIGLLDVCHVYGNFDKILGFRAAHEKAGLEVDSRLVYCPVEKNSAEVGYRRAERFMRDGQPPTAIVCTSDVLAVGMQSWCFDNGVTVPGELSIAGFDDIPISAHLPVPLTTVRYSVEEVSRRAVQRLIELMSSTAGLPAPTCAMVAPEVIVRKSTRPLADQAATAELATLLRA